MTGPMGGPPLIVVAPVILYGFSIINIPIGLCGAAYKAIQYYNSKTEDEAKENLKSMKAWATSALPIGGPLASLLWYK